MAYIEGFLTPVPADGKAAYLESARSMAPILKELGATRIVECWGDDIPAGTVTDFRRAVQAEAGETVAFSWIEYPSKAVRDAANAAMMNDPRMADIVPPFDAKRMIFGGFVPIFES